MYVSLFYRFHSLHRARSVPRKTFPNMEEIEPFNVIYQTAEDGMGDTIKPRLVEAGADLSRGRFFELTLLTNS